MCHLICSNSPITPALQTLHPVPSLSVQFLIELAPGGPAVTVTAFQILVTMVEQKSILLTRSCEPGRLAVPPVLRPLEVQFPAAPGLGLAVPRHGRQQQEAAQAEARIHGHCPLCGQALPVSTLLSQHCSSSLGFHSVTVWVTCVHCPVPVPVCPGYLAPLAHNWSPGSPTAVSQVPS